MKRRQENKAQPWPFFIPNNEPGCENKLNWLNTKDNTSLSLDSHLKNKFIVVDFWTSCCINCIHVLAEMDELETTFKDLPEVAFLGCHSAKFQNEKDLHMLRQAVERYNIKHAVLNDDRFLFWR